jgi:hypothetical protein
VLETKFIGLKKGVIGVFEVVNILYDITQFGILNVQKKCEFAMWNDVAMLWSRTTILSPPKYLVC